jgi:Rubisco Assembly chaperone C-terminal domain/Rubisco accumulation factor 1 alpha helical domain/Rubisco accumulation factor 1 helix turn helix domain
MSENSVDVDSILQGLRRKEGNWVEWGQACQTLQKSGLSQQEIFEATGFEPIHQNQITVAAQVYETILKVGVSDGTRSHYGHRGSDILYELRILTQADRAATAEFILDQKLDADDAREIARAVKDYSRLSSPPEAFTSHPGDAVAYQAWKAARQKSDLQERSRLIARGLRFAASEPARKAIEQLLTDFSVSPSYKAPRMPVYRLDSDEELPRILPVVGKFPLTKSDLNAVPLTEETGVFQLVQFTGTGAWITLPGWQVIRSAMDAVVFLCQSDQLPNPLPGAPQEVVVVVDRAQREWNLESYFLVAEDEQLQLRWFDEAPAIALLGRLILVMRPKKVLEEGYTKEQLSRDQIDMMERWTLEE